jgi:hypothetical protein
MTMTYRDPRLANELLLRLAAWRLTHGPRPEPPLPDLPEDAGLCALLQHAEKLCSRGLLPTRDPFDTDGLEETGMGRLLKQAREWMAEQEGQV